MLRLVLPKGSLEAQTLQLFDDADLGVLRGSDVDYRGTIDDPRIDEVRILRPQEIPQYVADGRFDLGITGRDWIEERNADVVTLTELHYCEEHRRADPCRARGCRRLSGHLGHRPAERSSSCTPSIPSSHAATSPSTESTPTCSSRTARPRRRSPTSPTPSSSITETGRALRAAGLKIIDTVMVSYTELIANPQAYQDPAKRKAMEQLQSLLTGVLEARGRVLLKLNVDAANLDAVVALLPALKSPTVSKLSGEDGYAVETVVSKSEINTLIPDLKDAGAAGIIELPIAKIVH